LIVPRSACDPADPDRQAPCAEDPDYLTRQLLTYIGNKRALLGFIGEAVERVKDRLGQKKLRILDAFSGSGVVSRFFKAHASLLISNDFEDYAAVTARCFLRNRETVDWTTLKQLIDSLNQQVEANDFEPGFIEQLYAPRDETEITAEDRVFYTRENARRLDNYRRLLDTVPSDVRDLLLGPLLSRASVHANTAGVFKGFYKNRETGIGQFGGSGGDALSRIRGQIVLDLPVLSRFSCEVDVRQEDANVLAGQLQRLDLAYVDPPYNQHPYGSNYFMLNLLVRYQRPVQISPVSGIPSDWRRSGYNVRSQSLPLLEQLLEQLDTKFALISFNNEGFITPQEMTAMLGRLGKVELLERTHQAFRGSRNLRARSLHVVEQLFLLEKS
jgi:adenine-specific DNA-methyltransferase